MKEEQRKRAEDLSIEWQLAHKPMALGGDDFADIVREYNINPAFVDGYEKGFEGCKDILLEWAKDRHEAYRKRYKESNHTCGEHWGQKVAFRRMIDKLQSM